MQARWHDAPLELGAKFPHSIDPATERVKDILRLVQGSVRTFLLLSEEDLVPILHGHHLHATRTCLCRIPCLLSRGVHAVEGICQANSIHGALARARAQMLDQEGICRISSLATVRTLGCQ